MRRLHPCRQIQEKVQNLAEEHVAEYFHNISYLDNYPIAMLYITRKITFTLFNSSTFGNKCKNHQNVNEYINALFSQKCLYNQLALI